MKYIFRKAGQNDISFIVEAIIEAEKSGTPQIGLANMFDLTEKQLHEVLLKALQIENEGSELSLKNYIIAEYEGKQVGTFGGWIECDNKMKQSSDMIKSTLLSCLIPKENLLSLQNKWNLIKDFNINRTPHTLQLENAYVVTEYRGNGLMEKIIKELLHIVKKQKPDVTLSQIQLYGSNTAAYKAYQRIGYKEIKRIIIHEESLKYFPSNIKILMERDF